MPLHGAEETPAQPPSPAKAEPGTHTTSTYLDRFKAATESLKLTEEQKPKIDNLFDTARKQIDSLDEKADPNEHAAKVGEIFAKLRKDVGDVLTNEQKLEIQKKLAPAGPGVMIDKIKAQLDKRELKLTDDQKKKVDEVLDDTKQKLTALRTQYPKGGPEVRDKVRDILGDMRQKLTAILSPEQDEKLKSSTSTPSAETSKPPVNPSK